MMKNENVDALLLGKLRALRWREGVRCPRCGSRDCAVHALHGAAGRRKLLCYGCGRTFNDLTGTPLAHSHLPLSTWAAAARLMGGRTPTCSELARRLRVKVATAWRLRRLLSSALADPVLNKVLLEEPPCA